MNQDRLNEIWDRVRSQIRKVRGSSGFRGQETHLFHQAQIRLPLEARRGQFNSAEIVLHLSDAESDIYAEHTGTGERYQVRDFQDLESMVTALLAICRDGDYLHTSSKQASYRDGLREETKTEN